MFFVQKRHKNHLFTLEMYILELEATEVDLIRTSVVVNTAINKSALLSRVWVIYNNGVWIGNWIYCSLLYNHS
jgi:hypothetical protein